MELQVILDDYNSSKLEKEMNNEPYMTPSEFSNTLNESDNPDLKRSSICFGRFGNLYPKHKLTTNEIDALHNTFMFLNVIDAVHVVSKVLDDFKSRTSRTDSYVIVKGFQ